MPLTIVAATNQFAAWKIPHGERVLEALSPAALRRDSVMGACSTGGAPSWPHGTRRRHGRRRVRRQLDELQDDLRSLRSACFRKTSGGLLLGWTPRGR